MLGWAACWAAGRGTESFDQVFVLLGSGAGALRKGSGDGLGPDRLGWGWAGLGWTGLGGGREYLILNWGEFCDWNLILNSGVGPHRRKQGWGWSGLGAGGFRV